MYSQAINESIDALPKLIYQHGSKKILLFHGKSSFSVSGAKDQITLNSKITEYFDEITSNPELDSINLATKIFKRFKPDTIIAIGGGSVIDTAKSVLAFSENSLQDIFCNNIYIPEKKPFFIAVPTTAGSGSESTHFAVLYVEGKKYSIANNRLIPDAIVLDPELTISCPKDLTICSGIDAICQCVESYWSNSSTVESRDLAIKGLSFLMPTFFNVINHPQNIDFRKDMLLGSNLSGKAINISKTTSGHALSYSLTSNFHIPHGLAVLSVMQFLVEIMNSRKFSFNILNNLFLNMIKILHQLSTYLLSWYGNKMPLRVFQFYSQFKH